MNPITYVRGSGAYLAESVRPVPGSPEAAEMERRLSEPGSPWRRLEDRPPESIASTAPPPVVDPPLLAEPPARSAAKAGWVAFVVEHRGVDQAVAEAMTRDQLAEQYGGATWPAP
ncbi:hypothetical protein [Streptomyces sp. SID3343]|uniref:hypothetical protein n=1 Tax=Streptomyces sp. SID3343 TaxID=2690260 RepID=UPI001369534D|nr:hypothetical protein [Streptomyces sp. SID3343]MYW03468.1 hypothetical protein [Streptomyces sp. SID3343]